MKGPVALFVVLSLLSNGYVYGIADHGITVVFAHPERFPGDLLAGAAARHPSLFWLLQRPLHAVLPDAAVAGALHLGVLAATGAAIVRLARALGADDGRVLLALGLAAPAWPVVGGVATFDPLLLPRGAALALELLAFALLIEGRRRDAFALAGAAVALHAPSGVACTAALLVAAPAPREAVRGLGVAVAVASPVVAWWMFAGGPAAGTWFVDDAWRTVLDARLAHHLDPAAFPLEDWGWTTLWGAAALASVRARRLVLGLVAYGVVGVAVGRGLDVALALQLEPAQASRLVAVVGAVAVAARLPALRVARVPPAAAVAALVLAALVLGRWSPDGDRAHFWPTGPGGGDRDIAVLIAAEVPPGALVAVPPHALPSVRVHGSRPVFVTWKDGGEALFDRDFALEWARRMEAPPPPHAWRVVEAAGEGWELVAPGAN